MLEADRHTYDGHDFSHFLALTALGRSHELTMVYREAASLQQRTIIFLSYLLTRSNIIHCGLQFASWIAGGLLLAADVPELIPPDTSTRENLKVERATISTQQARIIKNVKFLRLTYALFDNDRSGHIVECPFWQAWKNHKGGMEPDIFMDNRCVSLDTRVICTRK